MTNTRFKPGLTLTVAVGLAFVILLGLGTWQAQKIGPKTELIESINAGLSAEPIELSVHVDDPAALAYRRVVFEGDAIDVAPLRLFGTNLDGRPGYYLYKPVVRDFGRAVFVNFGWIPMELADEPVLPVGPVTLSGVLVPSATPGSFSVTNDLAKRDWFTADVFEMGQYFGYGAKDHYHFRIFADAIETEGRYPLGGQLRVDIPNDHLEYMLTWYGIALALLGVYIAYGFRKARDS